MLILLDESLPHGLRTLIEGHNVRTTAYQGWAGMTNGALIEAAEATGFDILITSDRGIRYQQNFDGRRIALILLAAPELDAVRPRIAEIAKAIEAAAPGSFVEVGR